MAKPADPSVVRLGQAHVPSQEDRETAEAMRVQAMSNQQRSLWLESVWGKLQRNASHFRVNFAALQPGARHFATVKEKNEFDEARELALALDHSVFAVAMRSARNEPARA